ncbi:uncharacterized protein LOC144625951 [Crassostrea virginica]
MGSISVVLSVFVVVCFVHIASSADDPLCRKLNSSNRLYCYQISVYSRCKETCKNLVLPNDGDKLYKDNLCPWGNYANTLNSKLDTDCSKQITGNCDKYCRNPSPSHISTGRNCCRACVDACKTAPQRDSNFKAEFPDIYG